MYSMMIRRCVAKERGGEVGAEREDGKIARDRKRWGMRGRAVCVCSMVCVRSHVNVFERQDLEMCV